MSTVWLHRMSSLDNDFAVRLLHTAWRQQSADEKPLSRYTLSRVLSELGVDMRDRGGSDERVLWEAQRLIDISGYLNAQHDSPWELEPAPCLPVSFLPQWWTRLRRKDWPRC